MTFGAKQHVYTVEMIEQTSANVCSSIVLGVVHGQGKTLQRLQNPQPDGWKQLLQADKSQPFTSLCSKISILSNCHTKESTKRLSRLTKLHITHVKSQLWPGSISLFHIHFVNHNQYIHDHSCMYMLYQRMSQVCRVHVSVWKRCSRKPIRTRIRLRRVSTKSIVWCSTL